MKRFGFKSRQEAVIAGEMLRSNGFFDHVHGEHDFKDEYLFYILTSH